MIIYTTLYLYTYWLYTLYVIVHLITCIYVLFWPHGLWPFSFNKLSCLVVIVLSK